MCRAVIQFSVVEADTLHERFDRMSAAIDSATKPPLRGYDGRRIAGGRRRGPCEPCPLARSDESMLEISNG